ncbi:competence protein CoiA [Ferruginibacter sp. SUN106]|uniref:competence protein CoiA n=1 Tax=Ferruginibacter sp. SUN106 TaxID=2978348 RepID=UPI003D35BC03
MLYAIVEGVKESASPTSKGQCPFCESEMVPKCGDFKSWHWAHKRVVSCDAWYKPETEWHRRWKNVFGIKNCEVILIRAGQKHIADIQTIHGRIIELQNSPINLETIESREKFYGSNMIWIINGIHFIENFITYPTQGTEFDTYTPEFEKFAKMHGFTPKYRMLGEENRERFKWKRPKQVWGHAKAQVYIDFGNEFLFFIIQGLGTSNGTGANISKKQFIIEHGGDESLVSTVINIK